MRYKLLTALLVSVFFIIAIGFSAQALASDAQPDVRVDTYHPSGITLPGGRGYATVVTGDVHNYGAVDVYGTMTATATTSDTMKTYTNTSERILFPALQTVTVSVVVEGPKYVPSVAVWMTFNKEGTSGTSGGSSGNSGTTGGGSTSGGSTSGGSTSGGSTTGGSTSGSSKTNQKTGTSNFDLGGVAGISAAVIAVGAVAGVGFVMMRKRRVTEQSLRRMSSFEFQEWVTKRIYGNPASQKDVYLGIDAYTSEGYPVQIRQDEDVGKRAIDSFAAALARNKQRTGTIVAFGFGGDAAEGVMKARLNYRQEIKTVTVKELLLRKDHSL